MRKLSTAATHCQTFPQGCCGCCVNMRWSPARIVRYLERNTEAARRIVGSTRPRWRDLVLWHWRRGGFWDHLLMVWLVVPTFGLSAWVWARYFRSCPFAGYLDRPGGRVGCLVHPLRLGGPDLRRHAFPLVPTAGCNRALRCGMLDAPCTDYTWDALQASLAGARSLARRRSALDHDPMRTAGPGRATDSQHRP